MWMLRLAGDLKGKRDLSWRWKRVRRGLLNVRRETTVGF